jgi:hypothetical protein
MRWNRLAAFGPALLLALAAGCLGDLSGVAPYATHLGKTYRLTYAGEADCELWPPKAPGGDYFILPFFPTPSVSKQKGRVLPEGTPLKLEGARKGIHDEAYVLVTLEDPAHKGQRIRASIMPKYLEGWPDEDGAN